MGLRETRRGKFDAKTNAILGCDVTLEIFHLFHLSHNVCRSSSHQDTSQQEVLRKVPKDGRLTSLRCVSRFFVIFRDLIRFIRCADQRRITTRSRTTEIPSHRSRLLYLGMQMASSVPNLPLCPERDIFSSQRTMA